MAGKSNPDRAHGFLTSVTSKQNTWCNIDDFLTPVFATTKYLWQLTKVNTIVSLTIQQNILIIEGVFKTVNFKSFSSALEKLKLIQVVFKEFKEQHEP